jgi:transcriptional regulator with XRE-family HTH domain
MKKKAAKKAAKKPAKTTQQVETPVSGRLRKALIEAIEANQRAGERNSELSRRSGVSQPQITRFLSGERDIALEVADKLCAALGLEFRKIESSAD